MSANDSIKIICKNRKARFNFEIEDAFEAGISLVGSEVKSLRKGKANLSDSYAKIRNGEIFLVDAHISPYEQGNIFNHDPDRERRLLAHRDEIKRLRRKVDERGYSLVPLKFYLKHGIVKVELGLGKGKKVTDKRQTIKQRDMKRDAERELRGRF